MKKISLRHFAAGAVLLLATLSFMKPHHPKPKASIQLGAYYFDGWAKATSGHLTPRLRDSFPDRKPKWGWVTSTPDIMREQIDLAADAGLTFFSFCWYYPDYNHQNFQTDPLNHAVNLYLKAPNKSRLKFNLMISNHGGQEIGPDDWPAVTDVWVNFFKDPGYIKVDGKPLIIFFNMNSLVHLFGSPEAVRKALNTLRDKSTAAGLSGASIAVCVSPTPEAVQQAKNAGFDIVTGYNYPTLGFKDHKLEHDVDSLNTVGMTIWNRFNKAALPYIPVATLNWDPRPWATATNFYGKSAWFTGLSANSVYKAVSSLKSWIANNPGATPTEHIALLYAWNEYGEGSWLTPTANDSLHLLNGIKKAVSEN